MKVQRNATKELKRREEICEELNRLSVIVGVQAEPGKNTFGKEVSGLDKYPEPKKAHEESNARQMTILEVALIHEYGKQNIRVTDNMKKWSMFTGPDGNPRHISKNTETFSIPERAWLRQAREYTLPLVFQFMKRNIHRVLSTGELTPMEFMEAVGAYAVDQIVGTLGQVKPPKKDQSKNRKTLMQSGLLQEHITYRVVKK